MTHADLAALVVDPDFAGLHWSIPKDIPLAEREHAHILAALRAKRERDKVANRPIVLLDDPQKRLRFLGWPNGSMTWETDREINFQRWHPKRERRHDGCVGCGYS